jgi:uncharacterized protein
MHVSGLHIYPVKGARGISLAQSEIEAMGLQHDRRWMIADAAGECLTQRDTPALAQLDVAVDAAGGLTLSVAGQFREHVAIPAPVGELRNVTVWKSHLTARPADEVASKTLSAWLEKPVTLVHFSVQSSRLSSPAWAGDHAPVAFADGYPVLVTLTQSLDDLNRRMAVPVPMARFRANIIVDGADAWADDSWQLIKIGSVTLALVKPCDRCLVTLTDQTTGARRGPEPLATLAKFRRSAVDGINGVLFGANAVPQVPGQIRIGDSVSILKTRTPWAIAPQKQD